MSVTPVPFPDASLPLPDPEDLSTWGARMAEMHRWMRETARPGINNQGEIAFQNAAFAEQMAEQAMSAAAFAGEWSGLTGSLNVPAATYHNDRFWVLLSNLVDVTAAEPGVSGAWVEFVDDFAKTTGATFSGNVNVPSLNGGQLAGNRNKLINGNFQINQRVVSGVVVLAAGARGHDGWKAGAGGCTYTFAASAGVVTLTISAGSLIQTIDGNDLQNGEFVLSWGGTAQGRIGAGSYSAAGVTASVTGGINLNIEFNTGTLRLAQFEPGIIPTVFEHRLNELQLCQSRLPVFAATGSAVNFAVGVCTNAGTAAGAFAIQFPVTTRVAPTGVLLSASLTNLSVAGNGVSTTVNSFVFSTAGSTRATIAVNWSGGAIGLGDACFLNTGPANIRLIFTGAEL